MNKFIYFALIFIISSCQKDIASNPSDYLSNEELKSFKSKIVRYYERLPKKANHHNKWDTTNNDYYVKKALATDLMHYYKNEDGYIYFAVAKIAPSLKIKKVATIGKLKFKNDSIIYYEEIARTWKMEIPELKEKTKILFDLIVQEKNVEKYYTKNSQPEFWIEFPDDINKYNVEKREWVTINEK
jgi:hypothetical protein